MLFDCLWILGVVLAIMLTAANTWLVIWLAEHKPMLYEELRKPKPIFFLMSFLHITHPYIKGLLTGSLINELPDIGTIRKLAVSITVVFVLFELSWILALLALFFKV